ncbi:hypothetical protein BCEN4_740104 [Burkholderia cenocepacia]|nr:hypothetical protein BCEN4_740104 [Burkholderia cenocepacia]
MKTSPKLFTLSLVLIWLFMQSPV